MQSATKARISCSSGLPGATDMISNCEEHTSSLQLLWTCSIQKSNGNYSTVLHVSAILHKTVPCNLHPTSGCRCLLNQLMLCILWNTAQDMFSKQTKTLKIPEYAVQTLDTVLWSNCSLFTGGMTKPSWPVEHWEEKNIIKKKATWVQLEWKIITNV